MNRHRCQHCGSRLITWSPQQLVAAAQQWAARHGRPPRPRDWSDASVDHPSQRTVYTRFDTWEALLDAAGLTRPHSYRRWTRDEIVHAIFEWHYAHGRLPLANDWNRSSTEHPSRAQVVNRFGSWGAAIVAAGYKPIRAHRGLDGYARQAGAVTRARGARA